VSLKKVRKMEPKLLPSSPSLLAENQHRYSLEFTGSGLPLNVFMLHQRRTSPLLESSLAAASDNPDTSGQI